MQVVSEAAFFQPDARAHAVRGAGGEVTVADFALYGVVARMKAAQPALLEGFANVARWADEMSARPAVQRAMKF